METLPNYFALTINHCLSDNISCSLSTSLLLTEILMTVKRIHYEIGYPNFISICRNIILSRVTLYPAKYFGTANADSYRAILTVITVL